MTKGKAPSKKSESAKRTDTERLEAAKLLAIESGIPLHKHVINSFSQGGWAVLIGPHFVDNITDKPRELDLIAERVFLIDQTNKIHTIKIRLYIECKYVPDDATVVAWFKTKDISSTRELIKKGSPNSFSYDKHPYWYNSKAARLIAESRNGKNESGIVAKALNQVISGYLYFRTGKTLIPDASNAENEYTYHLPVIVLSSFTNLFSDEIADKADISRITENFQIETDYSYFHKGTTKSDYFLVDVLSQDTIHDFLKLFNEVITESKIALRRQIRQTTYVDDED